MPGRESLEEGSIFLEGDRYGSEYCTWLVNYIAGEQYLKLLELLHEIEFFWSVNYDENRAKDGIDLRYRFYTEHGVPYSDYISEYPCSVFEMLVGLAIAIENFIMYDPMYGDRTPEWFWLMVNNLGIAFSDRDFNGTRKRSNAMRVDIRRRVDNMMTHNYDPHGNGSLFPVRETDEDMRRIELWDQANIYAIEKLI